MLKNTRVTDFTVSELLRENLQGGGGVKLPPPPPPYTRLGLRIAKFVSKGTRFSLLMTFFLSGVSEIVQG